MSDVTFLHLASGARHFAYVGAVDACDRFGENVSHLERNAVFQECRVMGWRHARSFDGTGVFTDLVSFREEPSERVWLDVVELEP